MYVSLTGKSPQVILRLPQVVQRISLSRSTIYSLIKSGQFPRQVRLGPRAIGFLSNEIDAWLESRIAISRK
ncbi:helix-turn-helix transcriptional regulator [Herbaspirillum sp. GCM10030257]|uniref:helix-turn-helix transcriptional regulator n=1 Tax=Herbaspirillum sp. GCM10030257 TaxID=3273393 RepID=UPI00360A045F